MSWWNSEVMRFETQLVHIAIFPTVPASVTMVNGWLSGAETPYGLVYTLITHPVCVTIRESTVCTASRLQIDGHRYNGGRQETIMTFLQACPFGSNSHRPSSHEMQNESKLHCGEYIETYGHRTYTRNRLHESMITPRFPPGSKLSESSSQSPWVLPRWWNDGVHGVTKHLLRVLDLLALSRPTEIQQCGNRGFLGVIVIPDTIGRRGHASGGTSRNVFRQGNGVEGDLLKGVITSLRPQDGMSAQWGSLKTLTFRPSMSMSLCDEWLARKRREPYHILSATIND